MRHSPLLHVTLELDHALRAVVELAGSSRPATCDQLADATSVSSRCLSTVLQKLRRAGVVRRNEGFRGGYELAQPPSAIRVASVVSAIQGVWPWFEDHDPDPLEGLWRGVESALERRLADVSVADLATSSPSSGRG